MKTNVFRSLIAGVCIFVTGLAHAIPITGYISATEGGGMVATESWSTDSPQAYLGWTVNEVNGKWLYEYVFQVPQKELSHFILETSSTFTESNIVTITGEQWALGTWGAQGNSNPGIPGDLYGIKWDGGDLINAFLLFTDRAPMWGSFYAKDGRDGTDNVYAYNASFGQHSDASIYGPAPFGFVLVPDTKTSRVPEPGSLALLGVGMIAAVGIRSRSKKHRS